MNAPRHLHLVSSGRGGAGTSWSDVLLLLLLAATHAIPLVVAAAGHRQGPRLEGYATVVVLVTGYELARELAGNLREWRSSRSRS